MALKRDPLDAVFSDLVRERSNWTCDVCGKYFPERKGSGIHASHYWGRRNRSVRWFGLNVFCHCFGCHQKLGGNPHEFKSWVFKELGEENYDALTLRANSVKKYTKGDRAEMKKHYEGELKRIRQMRLDGHRGYINFIDYD